MKKKYLLIGLLTIISVFSLIELNSCGKKAPITNEDVKDAIEYNDNGKYIPSGKYESLKELFVSNGGNEAEFDDFLAAILESDEDWVNVKVMKPGKGKPIVSAVYLDNTASMKGFFEPMSQTSDIKQLVSVFKQLRQNLGDTVPAFYIDNTGLKQSNLGDMSASINNRTMKTHDAYSMSAFLDTIVQRTLADSTHEVMTYFITDAIMSGTNKQIKDDPNYNINHADNLSADIAQVLGKLKAKDYGVALLRFTAMYDNQYINYHNGSEKITNDRPFFIIALGPEKEIQKLETDIKENNTYKPTNMLIAAMRPSSPTMILKCKGDDCEVDGKTIVVKSESEKPEVTFKFQLKNQPEYLRNDTTAKTAFDVTIDGKEFNLENASFDPTTATLNINRPLHENKTDYIVKIKVRKTLPSWVEELNSNNDENIKTQLDKTFNLKYLVDGLISGIYNLPSGDYLTKETSEYTVTKQ